MLALPIHAPLILFALANSAPAPSTARAAPKGAEVRVLFDFDGGSLGDAWTAQGEISVSRKELGDLARADGPGGHAARIEAGAGGIFLTRTGALDADWTEVEALSFQLHRAADAPPTVLEVWLIEGDNKTRFWRKLAVDHEGWERTELPLRHFRWAPGRIPRAENIARLAFYFREPGTVWIDDVALFDDPRGPGASLPLEELRDLAFDGVPADRVRTIERDSAVVLTDCEALDADELSARLDATDAALREDLGFLGEPRRAPRLIVFAEDERYRAFPGRFAALFASNSPPPSSDGYTFMAIATGAWSERHATARPTYVHEYVHAWMTEATGIDNATEWLQEGLAVRYQLRAHPQANFGAIVREGLEKESHRTPLDELCSGARIPTNRYWQAATVVDYLLDSDDCAEHAPALLAAISESGVTDLGPLLESTLGTDWPSFTAGWRAYCEATYGADD